MSFGAAIGVGLVAIMVILMGAAGIVGCADATCSGRSLSIAMMIGGSVCLVLALIIAIVTELRRK